MKALRGKKVLIVDDEPDLRELIGDAVKAAGAEIVEAENVTEALVLLAVHSIDAVISDVRMPGRTGIDLLNIIQSDHRERPVVFLVSGYSDISHEEAYARGADGIFSKPCKFQEIVDSLTHALEARKAEWTRKAQRVSAWLPIEISRGGASIGTIAKVLNLSEGGVFVGAVSFVPTIGESVKFRIQPEGSGAIEGTAICRWVRNKLEYGLPPGGGLQFTELHASAKAQISSLLEKTKTQ